MTVIEDLIQLPMVTWTGPAVGQTGVEVTGPMVSGTVTTLALSINPLQSSFEGQYVCMAVIDIPMVGVTITNMDSRDIVVQS